jgi:ADP-ribose pyrophosphatase
VLPDGETVTREVVEQDNAVAIVASDDTGRVMLVRHYRQPIGGELWELPAGRCDEDGEPPEQTARRELEEETGLRAQSWSTLVDVHPSPGTSNEAARVFLAEDLTRGEAAGDEHGEEAWLTRRWVSLEDAVGWVGDGRITNALAVAGILAASHHRHLAVPAPRPPDATWPPPTAESDGE